MSGEVLEVVVSQVEAPPHAVVEGERDEDGDEAPVLDQDSFVQRGIGVEVLHSIDVRLLQFLACALNA